MSYFKVSESNSFLFTDINSSVNKNDSNSTSCQNVNNYKYEEVQLYNTTDVIKTQFKSGHTIIDAFITDSSGLSTNLPLTKIQTNKGKTGSYSAWQYDYKGTGQLAIYYTTGSFYIYGTNTIDGVHALNGELPEYAIIGQVVEELFGNSYNITGIVYDEDVDSNVILTDGIWGGVDTNVIMQSAYDVQPYDRYEFEVDFSLYGVGEYYVEIKNNSSGVGRANSLTEKIKVQVVSEKTLEIIYYNDDDSDILYSTGIQHKIRLPYDKVVATSENDNEYIITDNSVNLVDSDIDDKNSFFFTEMTTAKMRKSKIALSSENVTINDINYVSDGTLTESNIDNTNMYSLEAVMIKTGVNTYVEQPLDSDSAAWAFIARCEADGATVNTHRCILADYENDY